MLHGGYDTLHVGGEPELEGLVVFVDYQGLGAGKVEAPAVDMVEQTPRGTHDYVGICSEALSLGLEGMSAVEGGSLIVGGSQRTDGIVNLKHQLARRGYHKSLYALAGRPAHRPQQSYGEGKSLAATRWGLEQHPCR